MTKKNYIIIAVASIVIIYGFVFFYTRTMQPEDILITEKDIIIKQQIKEIEKLRSERDVRKYTDEELQEEINSIREMRKNR
jgi:hypothetical protein